MSIKRRSGLRVGRASLTRLLAAFGIYLTACASHDRPGSSAEEIASAIGTGALTATDAGVSSGELSAIQSFYDQNYYLDSDIANSFVTSLGQHVDCVYFASQRSVKAMQAQGIPLAPPPPIGPSPAAATASVLPTGGVDGTTDPSGNVRTCASGTVPKLRPSVSDIELAGGVDTFRQLLHARIRPNGSQNPLEHDCYDNPYPLNLPSIPSARALWMIRVREVAATTIMPSAFRRPAGRAA